MHFIRVSGSTCCHINVRQHQRPIYNTFSFTLDVLVVRHMQTIPPCARVSVRYVQYTRNQKLIVFSNTLEAVISCGLWPIYCGHPRTYCFFFMRVLSWPYVTLSPSTTTKTSRRIGYEQICVSQIPSNSIRRPTLYYLLLISQQSKSFRDRQPIEFNKNIH